MANTPLISASPQAAMIAIGDELLCGRTRDSNITYAAICLTKIGIDLKEVRIIADDEQDIIRAVNELRQRSTHLITCGGIGATHDDITAPSIARALSLPCIINQEAEAILASYYKEREIEFTPSRRLMARMPQGASLIGNPISGAPGFSIANVHVLAGVPAIFKAMLDNLLPTLAHGTPMLSLTLACPFPEGEIAPALAQIQDRYPTTQIGSYPQFETTQQPTNKRPNFKLELVVRSRDEHALQQAGDSIKAMIANLSLDDKNKNKE